MNAKLGIMTCLTLLGCVSAFALGSDHPNDRPVSGTDAWPAGLKELVNCTNRVHGFFVNAEDIFFFAGNATNFSQFLSNYSKIQGVEKQQLILHEGNGEAKSPWSKSDGKPCDWKIHACPKSWRVGDAKEKAFILEVHFWTGGKIKLEELNIPKNVEVTKVVSTATRVEEKYLADFESIKPGMTRAEVQKRFNLDGGLQGVSPVRFVHPSNPGVKVKVEFDFKRDAADQGRAITSPDDKVIRVSKPYLEPPFLD